jgi:hypothetical protein
MFTSLHQTISSYPSPALLRKSLREHLYDALARTAVPRGDPQAVRAYITRELAELDADAEADVDVIRDANEQLLAAVEMEAEKGKGDGISRAYVSFLEEWCLERQNVDIYLVRKPKRQQGWNKIIYSPLILSYSATPARMADGSCVIFP